MSFLRYGATQKTATNMNASTKPQSLHVVSIRKPAALLFIQQFVSLRDSNLKDKKHVHVS
jgi:hypothetical protein